MNRRQVGVIDAAPEKGERKPETEDATKRRKNENGALI